MMEDSLANQEQGNEAVAGKIIKVLLADDHGVVRAGIRQFLERSEEIMVVAEAEDGAEALRFVQQYRPDVAVLDIQMPKASGIEVTRQLRSKGDHTGILILTAYDDDPYVLAVLQAGANGYVLKTASPGDIIRAVRDVYEGKSALGPGIAQKVMAYVAAQRDQSPVDELTDREMEVLTLVGKGYTNKAIGLQLRISDRTVQGHLAHIFNKLQASSRTEAVMRAVSLGWLSSDLGQLENES